jgi:hypothetical protein
VSTTPRVVIVDEHMAEQLWPNEDAVGKRIRTGGIDANANAPWITVVGVVGRIKQDTLDSDSRMAMYLAHTRYGTRAMNVVARSRVDPASLAAAARKEIRDLDADLPVYNVRNDDGARRRIAGEAPILDAAADDLRRARVGHRCDRDLRGGRVLRQSRHA